MSSYDIALILDAGTLNSGMSQLFANASAQAELFQGSETVGQLGVASVDWKFEAAPTFVLTPPTQAQWDNPNTFTPGGTKPANPTDQMFQITLSSVTTTFNMQSGPPIPLNFDLTIFAQVGNANNQVQLSNVAVLPSNPTSSEQLYLEFGVPLLYQKVQALLAGYKIPSTITVEGQQFTPPVMTVTNGYLVVASNLTANGTPDISGVSWPQQPLGVLISRSLMSAMLAQFTSGLVQNLDGKTVNYSDSNWAGSYSLTGGISNVSIAVASTLPNVNLSATLTATADVGVSWWLVPEACALEAASNLL
jgi:hypothetical protein